MSRSPSTSPVRRKTGHHRERRQGATRQSSPDTRSHRRRERRSRPAPARWLKWFFFVLSCGVATISSLLVWSLRPASSPRDGAGPVFLQLDGSERSHVVERLGEAGLVESPRLMWLYMALLLPTIESEPGEHLLRFGLTPRELSARLARLPRRGSSVVAVPEGWHRRSIARRLEESEVCRGSSFLAATERAELLRELEITAPTAEGYLFPATYEFAPNTPPERVIRRMVRETRKRLQALREKHPGAMERLFERYGWSERELLTLASIVEKETARGSERPLIASVFLNRLRQPEGETRGRLQSDPTAVYGCEYEAERAASCAQFDGQVRPALLRDAANRYNTYRHPGLPPGPIANPGLLAMEAAIAPAESDYFFFVADGAGSHTFSRTFEEHQAQVARLRRVRGTSSFE